MPEVEDTILTPSSSLVKTSEGLLICELDGPGVWKLVGVTSELLKQAEKDDAVKEDGSIVVDQLSEKGRGLFEQREEVVDLTWIVENTRLSSRQAEVYAWKQKAGLSLSQTAEEMGISKGNAGQKWHAVKRKIREAEKDQTAELEV